MPLTREQKLAAIQKGIQDVAAKFKILQERIATEGITTAEGRVLLPPTAPPTAPPTPPTAPTPVSPYEGLIGKLTTALETATPTTTMEAQWGALGRERGIPGLKETIGTFDEELMKTQDLLSDLEIRIRRGMGREEARLAPMEVITGRKAALEREAAYPRADILATIESLQRGREAATGRLGAEETDILRILEMREAERSRPLELLSKEIELRQGIGELEGIDSPEKERETKSSIVADINRTIDQYKINPAGFRERFIESLIATYGEDYRDYINRQVYSLMPDIIAEPEEPKEPRREAQWELTKRAVQDMSVQLESLISRPGRADRYLSPEEWMQAKTAWTNQGLDPEDFIQNFYIYINPDEPRGIEAYGIREGKYLKGETPLFPWQ